MRIGCSTIGWGIRIENIESVLDVVATAGFEGIEFAQRPDTLGNLNNIGELVKLLNERNLKLLGLMGGTLLDRINFCQEVRPVYLRAERGDLSRYEMASEKGFTLAIKPRAFSSIRRLEDLPPLFTRYPELQLVLDTSETAVAGDSISLLDYQYSNRLIALHLKDWTSEYGRSSHRYTRGYTDLGTGVVNLTDTLDQLNKMNYDGWMVVGLGNPSVPPTAHAVSSARWLHTRGVFHNPIPHLLTTTEDRWRFPRSHCTPEAEAKFLGNVIMAISEEREVFYEKVAQAFNEVVPSNLVTIWMYSPSQNHMGLLASVPQGLLKMSTVESCDEMLCGLAIDRHAPTTSFDLTRDTPGDVYGDNNRQFRNQEIISGLQVKRLVAVPIYNSGNQDHVRLLVNLYPNDELLPLSQDEAYWLGRVVTTAADAMLDRLCFVATTQVNTLAGKSANLKEFLSKLVNFIRNCLNAEGTAIFLVNDTGDRLELQETTGTKWFVPKELQHYTKGEGLTGTVWSRNELRLTINSLMEAGHIGKSEELVSTSPQKHACLLVPLVDQKGKVIGVVRCRNKWVTKRPGTPNMFSEDDAAILDAINQAAAPHLQVLIEDEQRARALGRLTHELKVPLVVIRSAAESMMMTKGVETFFDFNYPGDIWSWSELMRRLLGNADLLRYTDNGLLVNAEPTLLMGEVIAPVVKQVRALLRDRKFPSQHINYSRFSSIPKIWIDRNQFQQVIFNLLSNAIKYSYDDPKSFQVEIIGERRLDTFVIQFRDWGPGIEQGMEEIIFEEGIRTPFAKKRHITGNGLGLWVVRRIVEAHDGEVKLTRSRHPTEISIYLPSYLAEHAPIRTPY